MRCSTSRASLCLLCILAASSSPAFAAQPSPSASEIPAWVGQSGPEPFDVKQYLASRQPPADNAADLYKKAFQEFDRPSPADPSATIYDEVGKFGDLQKLASGQYPADQIDNLLKATQPLLAQVDAAQMKPNCVFVTALGYDANLPHAQSARALARLCNLELYRARQTGDFDRAETAIKRSLRVSRDLRQRGHQVCQLVSVAIDSQMFSAIETQLLNDPRLTAEQCDRILSHLLEHQQRGLNRIDEGLHMEYLAERSAIHDIQSGRLTIDKALEYIGADGGPTLNNLPLNTDAEISACHYIFAAALKDLQTASGARSDLASQEIARIQTDAKAKIASKSKEAIKQVPFLVLIVAGPLNTTRDADLRARAHLAGLEMLVALKKYELAHGHFQSSLDTAAAETALKTTPTDPYSGTPIKFATVNGKPTIYSIGKDLKDDGGQIDWKSSTQPGDFLFVATPRPGIKPAPTSPPSAKPKPLPPMPMRTWTSTTGTKIEARLLAVEDKVATLQRKNGLEVKVPLDKLSPQDQQWIISNTPQ